MDKLSALLEQAASRLAGTPVSVRWRIPSRTDAKALAFRTGGRAVIDLHPGYLWDREELLRAICHEAGHIRDLWGEWRDIPDYPSGSVQFSARALRLPVVERIESTADTWARRWLDYAQDNYKLYAEHGDSIFTAKLRALATWSDER